MKNTYWFALIGECGGEVSRCRQPTSREVEAGTEFNFTNLRGRPTHYAIYTKSKGGKMIKGSISPLHGDFECNRGDNFALTVEHGPMVCLF